MSRLDFITIAIVAACILAIIFLVFKMTDLFNQPTPAVDNIENTATKVEEEDDGVYDYNIEEDDEEEATGGHSSDNTTTTDDAGSTDDTTTSTYEEEEDEETTPVTTRRRYGKDGKYLVIAGTFSKEANADRQLRKLKNLGFNHASVEHFDRGKYAVLLVDRFDNMASAERLVKDLKAEGVSGYVKVKEGN